MSNYQQGSGPYSDDHGAAGAPGATGATYQGGMPPQEPPMEHGTMQQPVPQYQGGGGQQWGPQQGSQHGSQHGGFMGARGHRPNVRSTFKTTEFWVMVVVAIALLIAAAVTDAGADHQGFGAEDAWRYVTFLAIGYMISRGLTKFGGHEDNDDHQDHRHDHY